MQTSKSWILSRQTPILDRNYHVIIFPRDSSDPRDAYKADKVVWFKILKIKVFQFNEIFDNLIFKIVFLWFFW